MQEMSKPEPEAESEAETEVRGRSEVGECHPNTGIQDQWLRVL